MAEDQIQMLALVPAVVVSESPGSTQDCESKQGGLVFPWGWVAFLGIFQSRRCQTYLTWYRSLPARRRLVILRRLIGETSHRPKHSYPRARACM